MPLNNFIETLLSGTVIGAGGSAPAGNTAYTGVGFKPRAIIVFAFRDTSNQVAWSLGATDGTNEQCVGMDASNYKARYSDRVLYWVSTATLRADFVSFDSDGFTLNWTNASSVNIALVALCLR